MSLKQSSWGGEKRRGKGLNQLCGKRRVISDRRERREMQLKGRRKGKTGARQGGGGSEREAGDFTTKNGDKKRYSVSLKGFGTKI